MRRMRVTLTALIAMASGMMAYPVESRAEEAHEPITIMDANRDYTALIELVHEKYPEINVEIEPYRGFNTSAYMKKQLETGSMPDIYSTTYAWDEAYQKKNLIDLSKYAVSEMYNPARLQEYDVDGGIYLVPYDFSITGIGYNKALFEKNDIEVPKSFAQLRDETIPALKEAGIEISDCLIYQPGFAFQYFCNVSDTFFLNTIDGRAWQKAFLDGESDELASENPNIQACMDYFQQWIDCGMINANVGMGDNTVLMDEFSKGNTAFFLGNIQRYSQFSDGTGDQYGLLPYFSEDGTQNVYIVQNARCYGLNKKLEEPGNEQKLEDALHFLEVMSSKEGYTAIFGENSTTLCSVKEYSVSDDSPYKEALDAVNRGMYAPLIYSGWEDLVVPFGEELREVIKGESTGEKALAVLDDTKKEIAQNGVTVYANVTEELNTEQVAQLCGQMFMEATNADAAMITYNIYIDGVPANMENSYGANGKILTGPMTEQDIVSFLPTGWNQNLTTMDLEGSEIKKIVAKGLDIYGEGYYYPYLLITKDGAPLEDDQVYTLVFNGLNDEEYEYYPVEDTGILGLDVAKEYFKKVGEVSTKLLDDSLVQHVQ